MAARIALIGMSGVGKSHWSSRLERRGVRRLSCDALIEERLLDRLVRADGTRMGMGEWMGFPFEPGYTDREEIYLAHEIDVMHEVLDHVMGQTQPAGAPVVIDTTGSVIYAGPAVLKKLAQAARIVYLEAPPGVQAQMQEAYRRDPAPVLWREKFSRQVHETNEAALARCYPALLASRSRAYKKIAHVTLDYHLLRSAGFSADDFWQAIGGNADR